MITSFSNDKIKVNISIINLISLLFIFRSSIPAFKYPFLLIYFGFLIYIVVSSKTILNDTKLFFKRYYLIILLVTMFILSTFLTYKMYLANFKDLLNLLILLSILFFYTTTIVTKEKIKFGLTNIVKWIIFLSTFMALYWIVDFLSIYLPQYFGFRNHENSLVDYNSAIIPALLGIVSILFLLPSILSKSRNYILNIILIILYIQLFLSSSRRGFIISNLILIIIFTIFFLSIFIKNVNIKVFAKRIRPFIFITTILFSLVYLSISQTSYEFKFNFLNSLGITNSVVFQEEITQKFFKYKKIFNPNKSFYEFYREIWNPNFDPYNPDSGWGTKIHKTIFPLTGKNVDILPVGAKGYLMDSTCKAYVWDGISYSYTNVDFTSNLVEENDTIEVSVYCYVSDNFNGESAFIVLTNNEGPWVGSTFYDIENKGTWQKLSITKKVSLGQVSTYLYFSKKGVNDFSSLKGFVIFAYPNYCNKSRSEKYSAVNQEVISSQRNKIIRPELSNFRKSDEFYKSSMNFNFITTLLKLNLISANDPIRNWAARFVSEDTSYVGYERELHVDTIYGNFTGLRIMRWQFAWQIFTKEYNWKQKIFGGGFAFFNWYGYYFLGDKTKIDWPHNPFLTVLLYSGIIGLLLYFVLLFRVLQLYIIYIKEYYLFFIFFLICFYFSFFSSINPFNPPVTGFFTMLPFLIHAVHKREDKKNLNVAQ